MPINRLYDTWFRRIRELRPTQRVTQLRNFVYLMMGIYLSRSVRLSRIAGKIPGEANLLSLTRRLSRFLDNAAMNVRDWFDPLAREWVTTQASSVHEVRLIVDGTQIGGCYQLLIVSLAYRRRAIPIAWTWVKQGKGHSSAARQIALLGHVRSLLPVGIHVLLVGDNEFGAVEVQKELEAWNWDYVLRQKARTHAWLHSGEPWRQLGSFVQGPGQSCWLGEAYLTEKAVYPVNLLVHWQVGEAEPWCLATNLPDRSMALQAYKRRMWIEEMFGDWKGHGFEIAHTRLRHAHRLSRLTLAVALLYLWCLATGAHAIRKGLRRLVDRKDRRDLSLFQIGLRFLERLWINDCSFQIQLCYSP